MQDVSLTSPPSLIGETMGELGEIFRTGVAGAIPNGRGKGTVLIGTGGPLARVAAALCYALAWRGKVVNARAARLKNIVTPLGVQAIEAAVYKQDSWYDGKTCIVLDYSKTSFAARKIRAEIREIAPGMSRPAIFRESPDILDFDKD